MMSLFKRKFVLQIIHQSKMIGFLQIVANFANHKRKCNYDEI